MLGQCASMSTPSLKAVLFQLLSVNTAASILYIIQCI